MNAGVRGSRDGVDGRVAAPRLLDPLVLARIGNLDLIARGVVDGFVSGLHRARNLGMSTDFAEHRAYSPGDDVRRIDWRLFARSDRLHVKTFEAETNSDLVLALDASRSMDYAAGELSKLDYARMLLASLAHLGSRQRDRVGFASFASVLLEVVPPAAGRRDAVVAALERVRPTAGADLATALDRLGAALLRRGVVVVVSDFYLDAGQAAAALGGLRARGHDVIAFQVLDRAERELDLDGPRVLEDLETGARMPVVPERARAAYRTLLREHVTALGDACIAHGVEFVSLDTSAPLDHALFRFLSERARARRLR
jgi:uncharacterized protein (DUF58 family)